MVVVVVDDIAAGTAISYQEANILNALMKYEWIELEFVLLPVGVALFRLFAARRYVLRLSPPESLVLMRRCFLCAAATAQLPLLSAFKPNAKSVTDGRTILPPMCLVCASSTTSQPKSPSN